MGGYKTLALVYVKNIISMFFSDSKDLIFDILEYIFSDDRYDE